ncbi:hypothetical protein LCGC14_2239740 [marine sediment metagenome]|uniref:Homing endonuclease LAGLIDADG domain-containing protein n=1 Tax=marine sediment metagenome TaxID=412755 RepID=A0A0F9FIC4_9ZZZZ
MDFAKWQIGGIMTDLEKGWLAGIIDGEGCITLRASGTQKGKKPKYRNPVINVTSTDKEVVNKVLSIVNCGTITHYDQNRCKTAWRWNGSTNATLSVLREVYTLLTVPKKIYRAIRGYHG